MPPTIASSALSDRDFLTHLQSGELPLDSFRHGDHLRFAWLMVHQFDFATALEKVRDGIKKFAGHHGASHIFHETVTQAWVTLISTHSEPSFAEFISGNSERLNHSLLHRFWTPAVLDGADARSRWIAPDKAPLPTQQHPAT